MVGPALAVARDLRRGRACRAAGRRPSAASMVASAGRTRAATSGSDSPPGAQTSVGRPPPGRELVAVACRDLVAVEALPLALADLGEAGIVGRGGRPAGAGIGRVDRVGGLGRPSERGVDDLERRPVGNGQGRRPRGVGEPARRPARPGVGRSPDSGESARPWNRPSTMNSTSPWRTRTSVASRPSGIERAACQRSLPEPDRPEVA